MLFWTSMLLAGLLVVLGCVVLAQDRASRAWEKHEARRRQRWDAALAARRKTEP